MTSISYLDEHLPLVTGCSRVGAGCDSCYACKLAATRLKHHPFYRGLAFRDSEWDIDRGEYVPSQPGSYYWTGEVREHPELLDKLTPRQRPMVVGLAFTGDLMMASDDLIEAVKSKCRECPQHTFMFTTKRPELLHRLGEDIPPNLWPGVSVWDRLSFERACLLLAEVNCEVVWLSAEPLLSSLGDVESGLEWANIKLVIVGGESGKGARPMHPDWVTDILHDCRNAGVCFYFKQWGAWEPSFCFKEQFKDAPPMTPVLRLAKDGHIGHSIAEMDGHERQCLMVRTGVKHAGNTLGGRQHLDLPWRAAPDTTAILAARKDG